MRARPRRLRRTPAMRALVRETDLHVDDLVLPVFVALRDADVGEVPSMPGIRRWPVGEVAGHVQEAADIGIRAVILFGIPAAKDPHGSGSHEPDGVIQRAVRAIRNGCPEVVVITDTCMCEYTDHGHCGILDEEGRVDNDATLEVLREVARSQAEAGADVVAPSGMIDGAVAAIREALDSAGHEEVAIMSYSAKYASAFYGPFRDAAQGAPSSGDRRGHQMDPANRREAIRENELDVGEGADFLMVKPALAYGDVILETKRRFPHLPLVAYNVSGEYAMVKAAAGQGWIDERAVVLEALTGLRRAGADLVITYHATAAARWLAER